eukprot:SAG11_NODE_1538_length_4723_cov_5.640138_4_plen_71_part_00
MGTTTLKYLILNLELSLVRVGRRRTRFVDHDYALVQDRPFTCRFLNLLSTKFRYNAYGGTYGGKLGHPPA